MPRLKCKRCGALNPMGAEWCGQCHGRFKSWPEEGRKRHPSAGGTSPGRAAKTGGGGTPPSSVYEAINSRVGQMVESQLRARCPHCGIAPVQGAVKCWIIRGLVIFFKVGLAPELGCEACLLKRIGANFLANFLLGWWSVTSAILTPFVLLQNLFQIFTSPRIRERNFKELLAEVGLSAPSEVIETASFLDLIVATCSGIAWADGSVTPEEAAMAARIVARFSDDFLEEAEIRKWVESRYRAVADPARVDLLMRLVCLHTGALVAVSDGSVSPSERKVFGQYADWLGIPRNVADEILEKVEGMLDASSRGHARWEDEEVRRARRILGVDENVGPVELKRRYRELIMQFHPDLHASKGDRSYYDRKTAEINWAYEVLSRSMSMAG